MPALDDPHASPPRGRDYAAESLMSEVDDGPLFVVVAYNPHWRTHVIEKHVSVIAAMRRRNTLDAARSTTTTSVAALFGESIERIASEHPECFVGTQLMDRADDYVDRQSEGQGQCH